MSTGRCPTLTKRHDRDEIAYPYIVRFGAGRGVANVSCPRRGSGTKSLASGPVHPGAHTLPVVPARNVPVDHVREILCLGQAVSSIGLDIRRFTGLGTIICY